MRPVRKPAPILWVSVGVDMYANESWKAGMYTSILDIDSNVKGTKTGSDGKGGNIDDNAFYVGGYATVLGRRDVC